MPTSAYDPSFVIRTPKLDDIAAHGNLFARDWESTITCADGFKLSVVAGFAAYCTPRPGYGDVPRDYPGPYRAVEVMVDDDSCPDGWQEYESGGIYAFVPVELVRAYVEAHGGEVNR